MYRLRAGGTALLLLVVLVGLFCSRAEALTQTPNVVARDSHGRILPPDPLLVRGERIQLTVTGFAPHAVLQVRLGASTDLGEYRADATGRIVFTVVIPNAIDRGTYIIVAVGGPPISSTTPSGATATGTADRQLLEAVVPTLGLFTFRVDPGHSSAPPSSPHTSPSSSVGPTGASSSAGSSGTGSSGTGPAHTGVDVAALLLIALIGLVSGTVVMILSRARMGARHA
jgi:hypothetical protein